jgi:hypothetical protein
MELLSMPLSTSILQEFERESPIAYHVTDLRGFNTLVKLQGKRKDVACFTRGSEGISKGAITDGTILVKLSGKSSFYSGVDFKSRLDRNGNRWIGKFGDVNYGSENIKDSIIYKEFSKIMKDKIMAIYPIDSITDMWPLLDEYSSGKEKAEFIKWYYDETKKIINKKFIQKVQKNMAKLTGSSGGEYNNDELFLHDFKILEVDIIDKYDEGPDEYKVELNKLKAYKPKLISRWDVEKI